MSTYGGIDLGGTKIQAAIVDEDNSVLGSARRPSPTTGGPADVAAEMATALRDAAKAAEVELVDGKPALAGVGVGSPGTIEAGNVTSARNLPGWEGTFPLAATLESALGCRVAVGNDVQVATDAVFWGTGVGGGLILDGKPWTGRGGAGEIGHVVVEIDGARCTCGRLGCMEAYAGRAAMEIHVRQLVEEKGRKTDLFKLMKEQNRTRLTSGVWARALAHEDKLAIQTLDRAVRGDRLGDQRAGRGGRDHRRRAGRQARASVRQADRRGDAAASVPRLAPSARARRGAGRPRRGDRSIAAPPRRGVTAPATRERR